MQWQSLCLKKIRGKRIEKTSLVCQLRQWMERRKRMEGFIWGEVEGSRQKRLPQRFPLFSAWDISSYLFFFFLPFFPRRKLILLILPNSRRKWRRHSCPFPRFGRLRTYTTNPSWNWPVYHFGLCIDN